MAGNCHVVRSLEQEGQVPPRPQFFFPPIPSAPSTWIPPGEGFREGEMITRERSAGKEDFILESIASKQDLENISWKVSAEHAECPLRRAGGS